METLIQVIVFVFGVAGIFFGGKHLTGQSTARKEAAAAILEMAAAAINVIRAKVLGYTVEAEQSYGGGTGAVKLSHVLDMVTESAYYNALPDEVKRLITSAELTAIINDVVENKLKPQIVNNSAVRAIVGGK